MNVVSGRVRKRAVLKYWATALQPTLLEWFWHAGYAGDTQVPNTVFSLQHSGLAHCWATSPRRSGGRSLKGVNVEIRLGAHDDLISLALAAIGATSAPQDRLIVDIFPERSDCMVLGVLGRSGDDVRRAVSMVPAVRVRCKPVQHPLAAVADTMRVMLETPSGKLAVTALVDKVRKDLAGQDAELSGMPDTVSQVRFLRAGTAFRAQFEHQDFCTELFAPSSLRPGLDGGAVGDMVLIRGAKKQRGKGQLLLLLPRLRLRHPSSTMTTHLDHASQLSNSCLALRKPIY